MTPHSLEDNQLFRETCHFSLRGRELRRQERIVASGIASHSPYNWPFFLRILLLFSENGESMILLNVGTFLPDYAA
jgi:hypothetical protein